MVRQKRPWRILFFIALLMIGVPGCAADAATPSHVSQSNPRAPVVQQAPATPAASMLPPAETLPIVTFYPAGNATYQLHVLIADTLEEQETGLMNVAAMPDNVGELFIFPSDTITPFYMKDTLIPLSIAWIDDNGIIVDIQDMQPETLDLHYPAHQYRYAIEVNQGWYAVRGINVGDYVDLTQAYAASPVYGQGAQPTPAGQ